MIISTPVRLPPLNYFYFKCMALFKQHIPPHSIYKYVTLAVFKLTLVIKKRDINELSS